MKPYVAPIITRARPIIEYLVSRFQKMTLQISIMLDAIHSLGTWMRPHVNQGSESVAWWRTMQNTIHPAINQKARRRSGIHQD